MLRHISGRVHRRIRRSEYRHHVEAVAAKRRIPCLEAEPRVLSHAVALEGKLARGTVAPGNEEGVAADLCERLTASGFPSELQRDSEQP